MELKYLTTFKTILETGSFQKAAERLNYAQSTITLQMQLLEQELSVKLFEKIGRRMELTQAGGRAAALYRRGFGGRPADGKLRKVRPSAGWHPENRHAGDAAVVSDAPGLKCVSQTGPRCKAVSPDAQLLRDT